ncbi:monosaccharide-transporting ATPase [Caballeronia cordobensis]|nr:monosaccharide-transporting ATPase [Burkholderia sp. RPE67]
MMTRHSPTLPAMPAADTKRESLAVSIAKSRELTLFIVLLVLIGATAAVKPDFLNLQNLRDVLLNVSIIGLLTAGMTIVMLMRHIDSASQPLSTRVVQNSSNTFPKFILPSA